MLSLEHKAEMKCVIEKIYISFPPEGMWQEYKPYLSPELATFYETYWQEVAKNLDAFCSDLPEPNISYLTPPFQKLISVASHYYKITFLMIAQSEQKFLRPEVESWGQGYPLDKQFFLLSLMVEDYLQFLEILNHGIKKGLYESLSGQDWLNGIRNGTKRLKDEINIKVFKRSEQSYLEKEKKLSGSLKRSTIFLENRKCEILCLKVWYENQKNIPAYNSWVEALEQWGTMFTDQASAAFGMGKKFVAIYKPEGLLEIKHYPGRGKGKK